MPDLANQSLVNGRSSRVTRIAHARRYADIVAASIAALLGMGLALGILRSGRL
jgi:hypothetical protein